MLPHPDSQLHLQDACLIHGPLQIDTLAIQNGSGLVVLYIFHCQSSRLQSYCLNSQKSSFLSQPVKRQTMTLLSKHEKRDSRRLPNAANLSESLYFWAFLELFYLFRDSKTTVSTWLETVARMSTVHGNKSYAGV